MLKLERKGGRVELNLKLISIWANEEILSTRLISIVEKTNNVIIFEL